MELSWNSCWDPAYLAVVASDVRDTFSEYLNVTFLRGGTGVGVNANEGAPVSAFRSERRAS